jgi:hypothetical protein
MSLNKIDGGSLVPSAYRDRSQNLDQDRRVVPDVRTPANHASAPTPGDKPEPKLDPKPGDVAEISTRAHRLVDLHATVKAGRAALLAAPDVREERLAEVRERLATGFYNSSEVHAKVAARVARVLDGLEKL